MTVTKILPVYPVGRVTFQKRDYQPGGDGTKKRAPESFKDVLARELAIKNPANKPDKKLDVLV
ncbi:MAG TPA: hypothetical protein PKA28_09670 [Methylomusa anaerophila]|uniref:Uncharacterized protein n=1 Tax=Methylomusa anaerophila TaxID=1930071 RepID=A0A348AHZ2_9FIRM|nr:hypothetical protein [Methylomusa anaerophila]BBB90690.1 hypothetical protein MAMMFC1_01351 [Methylomusa anaerophila]HML88707.1 hypothetical protein [Methylomusa anaerophila]